MIEEKISRNTALAGSDRKNTTVESTMVGGIESSPVEIKDDKKKTSDSGARSTIYLPPSFVEATLLSGVTAKTSAQAKNDPSPMLFRIKDLAILPNSVKANLKGCFVIGEGIGDLATERVDARIVTLSCVSKNEESVIDQAVKGWVEDNADGKVGLSGRVVSKMGMAVARSALAGFLGGFGNAMSATTQNTALSAATGVPTSVFSDTDMKNYTKAGVGQGVKGATDDLQKFYLGLAEQSVPSIEVLPAKKVTLVFSEGVELKIKDVNLGRKK
jgi:conjugal transfer pilus assembly protein TraB